MSKNLNFRLQLLTENEIDLFNKAEEDAFNVHARYFLDGVVPGAAEDDRGEYDLKSVINDSKYTALCIYDDQTFIGGSIVEDLGNDVFDIGIFYLTVEYQSKGIGKIALELVENYFPTAKTFRLLTPSQVIRNTVFYVNKCGYKIVEVVDFDKEANTADYIFEKNR